MNRFDESDVIVDSSVGEVFEESEDKGWKRAGGCVIGRGGTKLIISDYEVAQG